MFGTKEINELHESLEKRLGSGFKSLIARKALLHRGTVYKFFGGRHDDLRPGVRQMIFDTSLYLLDEDERFRQWRQERMATLVR